MRFFAATGALLAIALFAPRAFGQCTVSGCGPGAGTVTCGPELIANGFPTTGRVDRDLIANTACGQGPSCTSNIPLASGRVKVFTFTNNTGAAACFTVTITTTCGNATSSDGLVSAAYLTTFDATGGCANQIADMGDNTGLPDNPPPTYKFTVANGAKVFVGVWNRISGQFCAAPYTVTISPCPLSPTASGSSVSGRITAADGSPLGGAVIHLSGAAARTTVSVASGNYHFDDLLTDSFYAVTPSLANYHFAPANRSFSLVGNMTDAGFTANADASQSANAIDMSEYFVRQQYLDFLGREPDQGGLEYWSDQINQCGGDVACISQKRLDVSAAFFMSAEFQQTGSYIYGVYAGTLGRTLNYGEFNADRSQVLGGSGLDEAKTAFAESFVQRPESINRYPQGMTREQFVDAVLLTMMQRSGVDQSSLRDGFLSDYDSGGRALVVRHASEASSFVAAEYNKAFVLMEYFGYMRREIDQGGYDYWLDVLNHGAAGNYREMVCAFLTSTEYQQRFSTVITRSNAECSGAP